MATLSPRDVALSLQPIPDESNDRQPLGSGQETPAVRVPGHAITGPADAAPSDRFERATRDARVALREAAAAAAEAADQARQVAAVLDEALAVLAAAGSVPPPPPPVPTPTPDRLSDRELEVLALVAEGRTNKAIAAALSVSPNTVKTHVASLLSKLHADNRAQLAAMAAKHGRPPMAPSPHQGGPWPPRA